MPAALAARRFLELEHARHPDWSGVTVLVPQHHFAHQFLAALRAQLDTPVFLAPRLATLPDLAAGVRGEAARVERPERVSHLYGLLSRFDWLEAAARWPMAYALHDLAEELDAALLAPPAAPDALERLLRRHARRMDALPLSREAALVHTVWQALHRGPAGPVRDYAARLADWAARHTGPLYVAGLQALSRLEMRFLEQCRQCGPVIELPVRGDATAIDTVLRAAWPDTPASPDLTTRAAHCRAAHAASPLAERFTGLELPDLEAEARAAADWIKACLAEGRPRIGLIALDRMLARRLRALLERESILVRDETGWSVHTSASSHVLGRMHDLIEGGFYFRDVLDMLKSAYCFADLTDPARALELPKFEAAVHRHSVLRGALPLAALARRCGCVAVGVLIERLADALAPLAATSTRTLAEWQTRLLAACDKLGVTPAWRADSAGIQLLERLDAMARGVAQDPARYTRQAWRHWLDMELERSTFRDDDIDSPVRLTHLQAAWLRDFDAVVLLGADAGRLPPAAQAGPLGDAVRAELGLPARAETHARLRAVLADLIARTPRVLATWHAPAPDEDATPAPWLGVLDTLHRLAWGTPLLRTGPVQSPQWPVACAQRPPAPVLDRVPARLSASGWQRLIDCPYRYFARDGLGLGEADEAREALEKRHYGELLHRMLSQFHGALPRLSDHTRAALRAELDALAEAVFGEAAVSDYLARAWHFRWLGHREAYLDWALRREAEGYQWLGAELAMERTFDLAHATVTLYGRLDRLDRHGDGVAVVDYKTQSLTALRARLKVPGEDVQLACYAWLAGAARAELVSLDDVRVEAVVRADGAYFEAEMARLRALLEALHAGAALPAQGTPEACARCEFMGLCRRAHWSEPLPPATH